jgi:hypothetical protein
MGRAIGKRNRRNGLILNTERQIMGISHNDYREREEGKGRIKEEIGDRECKLLTSNIQKKEYTQTLNLTATKTT